MDVTLVDDQRVPIRLPHFTRRGRELYFLVSRRPACRLDDDELRVYESIDGKRNVASLGRLGGEAAAAIERLERHGVIVLAPAGPASVRPLPRLLVVEPHMDDAALSVGGSLLARLGQVELTILAVVGRSTYTSYVQLKRDYLDCNVVSDLRMEESHIAARLLGGRFECLDWDDAPLRFAPAPRWSMANLSEVNRGVEAFVSTEPYPAHVEALAGQLIAAVDRLAPDELWVPIGLGHHVDHLMVHRACMRVLTHLRHRGAPVAARLYEDVPYTDEANLRAARAFFAAQGMTLQPTVVDITHLIEQKQRVLAAYASQFKVDVMARRVRASAERAAAGHAGRLGETLHHIELADGVPMPAGRLTDDPHADRLDREVRELVASQGTSRALTVIVLPSGHLGEWGMDAAALLTAFPAAKIDVFVAANLAWQLAGHAVDGGRLRCHVLPASRWRVALAVLLAWLRHPRSPGLWIQFDAEPAGGGGRSPKRRLLAWRAHVTAGTLADITARLTARPAAPVAEPGR